MDMTKLQRRDFIMAFWGVFIFGNVVIGILDNFFIDNLYFWLGSMGVTLGSNQSLPFRMLVLLPVLINFFLISYVVYSFIALVKYVGVVPYLRAGLIAYYVLTVSVIAVTRYCSPFSYLCSYIYTAGVYSELSDLFSYKVKVVMEEGNAERN